MRNIGVGVIGTGFMGKAHSFAYRAVAGIFRAACALFCNQLRTSMGKRQS